MMFRKGKRKPTVLFNKVPRQFFCPVCMTRDISLESKDLWAGHYKCGSCGCVFAVSTDIEPDDYKDEVGDMPGFIDIDWDKCPDPLETVRLLVKRNERVPAFIDDAEVIQWIRDYWSYVCWNEHGNELSYGELCWYNGYSGIIEQIIHDPDDLVDYITASEDIGDCTKEQVDLVQRLERIHRRLVV